MQYRKSVSVFFISLILCLQAIPALATESESLDNVSSHNEQKQEKGFFQTASNFLKEHGKSIAVGALVLVGTVLIVGLGGEPQQSSYELPTKTGGGGYDQPYIPAGNKNGGQYVHVE